MRILASAALFTLSACVSAADCPVGITPVAVTHQDTLRAAWVCSETYTREHNMAIDTSQRARVWKK